MFRLFEGKTIKILKESNLTPEEEKMIKSRWSNIDFVLASICHILGKEPFVKANNAESTKSKVTAYIENISFPEPDQECFDKAKEILTWLKNDPPMNNDVVRKAVEAMKYYKHRQYLGNLCWLPVVYDEYKKGQLLPLVVPGMEGKGKVFRDMELVYEKSDPVKKDPNYFLYVFDYNGHKILSKVKKNMIGGKELPLMLNGQKVAVTGTVTGVGKDNKGVPQTWVELKSLKLK